MPVRHGHEGGSKRNVALSGPADLPVCVFALCVLGHSGLARPIRSTFSSTWLETDCPSSQPLLSGDPYNRAVSSSALTVVAGEVIGSTA